ncbi:MAG TPA: NAD(+) diphosphatase [Kineosporiaceae bacterium]|nr:NAD(+) diphosphatase [Kineosporiaceae bacterium]
MTLDRLALSRSTLDRAAHRRTAPGLLPDLLADPTTAVLLLDGDRAPVLGGAAAPRLALVDPATAAELITAALPPPRPSAGRPPAGPSVAGRPATDARPGARETSPAPHAAKWPGPEGTDVTAFLGEDAGGRSYLLLATARPARTPAPGAPAPAPDTDARPAPDGARWQDLRAVGHLLDDTDAGLLTCAVALANWHAVHGCCARCGEPTEPVQAGWARACPACGAEHYPRTDPAVIMAVVDPADRILLGRQARWPSKRFSTLAGFVEPGESLEAAVRREVAEEAGVVVGEVRYLGSQPWPFPSSLMLGYRAQAVTTQIRVDGTELAQARWWTREEFALDTGTGELLLPPRLSIARRLIEDWYGGPVADAEEAWR